MSTTETQLVRRSTQSTEIEPYWSSGSRSNVPSRSSTLHEGSLPGTDTGRPQRSNSRTRQHFRESRQKSTNNRTRNNMEYLNEDLLSEDDSEADHGQKEPSSSTYRRRKSFDSDVPAQDAYQRRESFDSDVRTQNMRRRRSSIDSGPAVSPISDTLRHKTSRDSDDSFVSVDNHAPLTGSRLVIAVDFGTTYTGVAFSRTDDRTAELNEIFLVENWGSDMVAKKIPSVVSYSSVREEDRETFLQFGSSLSNNAVVMVNTKLELDVQNNRKDELDTLLQALEGMGNLSFANVEHCKGRPSYTGESPEAIVTFYLSKVFQSFRKAVDQAYKVRNIRQTLPVEIVISVPAAWSYEARNSTYRAVKEAGFNKSNFRKLENIRIIREPEAAALFALRSLSEADEEFLQLSDTFVLCDAGGGTVDVTACQVVKVEPRLVLQLVGKSECRKCGASYIDGRFKDWLQTILGHQRWKNLDPNAIKGKKRAHTSEGKAMRKIMEQFDVYKKEFPRSNRKIEIDLPKSLSDLTIGDEIHGGRLHITRKRMRSFFDPSVHDTVELIKHHVRETEKAGRRVKNVVMIGGFAASPYLKREIKEAMKLRKITLRQPQESWTAVVRGAVLGGIEDTESALKTKSCPQNYGINFTEDFKATENQHDDMSTDPYIRELMQDGHMSWLIRKGDLLVSNEVRVAEKSFVFTFSNHKVTKLLLPIYAYDRDEDVPEWYGPAREELTKVLELEVALSSLSSSHGLEVWYDDRRQQYCNARAMCRIQYTFRGEVDAEILINDILCASGSTRK